jgi:hypothetical protein
MLLLVASCCAVLASGAGVEQPKDPKTPGHPGVPAPKQAEDPKQPAVDANPVPAAKAEDVQSLDAIIKTFYDATAGPPGKARDWDRLRSLFVPGAKMIPVRHNPHANEADLMMVSVDSYIDMNRNYFEKGGFFEREAARRFEQFGNMAQVWSTYESRRTKDDPQPYVRGIYSFQLVFDGARWWIVNVMWDTEQGEIKLPEKYLQTPAKESNAPSDGKP